MIKDSTEPVYEELFDYSIAPSKLSSQELEVTVIDRKGIFARSPLMGRAKIPLEDRPEIFVGQTLWHDLYDDDDDSE